MRGEKATKPCAACGQELTRYVSQARGKNWFCDARCQAAHTPPPGTISRMVNPLRGQIDTRPCASCGEPVTRYLSERRLATFWTCSKSCQGKVRNRQIIYSGQWKQPRRPRLGSEAPCPQCGAPVYRQPGETRTYCSRACSAAGRTKTPVLKACAHCGKEMRHKPSQAAVRFCSMACKGLGTTKRPMERIHNGKPARKDQSGYILVWEPSHPNQSMKGWQYEHRLVAEAKIGRLVQPGEHVDHINRVKDDNRSENLQVLTQNEHAIKSAAEFKSDVLEMKRQVAEYERRYGPLPKEV